MIFNTTHHKNLPPEPSGPLSTCLKYSVVSVALVNKVSLLKEKE